ncbi:carbohydrate-binding protein [Streptomyces sp. NPDC085932]|uniref:carbohydrate-binding protein n=1 Tax=Streptomyces sp. NPDC085932 TaxID=3365741 RepID=UPI0037D6049A
MPARSIMEAEEAVEQSGGITVESGYVRASVHGTSRVSFRVDFGETPVDQVQCRIAYASSRGASAEVTLHLDSPTNPPISSLSVGERGQGGWQQVPGEVGYVTGEHTVHVVFAPGVGTDLLALDQLTFR